MLHLCMLHNENNFYCHHVISQMGLRVDNKKLAEVNSVFKSTCIFVRQQLDRSTGFLGHPVPISQSMKNGPKQGQISYNNLENRNNGRTELQSSFGLFSPLQVRVALILNWELFVNGLPEMQNVHISTAWCFSKVSVQVQSSRSGPSRCIVLHATLKIAKQFKSL